MAKIIIADLTPEEAGNLQISLDAILKEYRMRNLNIDAETLTKRLADAINSGERDFGRIKALALGPEAAFSRRAN